MDSPRSGQRTDVTDSLVPQASSGNDHRSTTPGVEGLDASTLARRLRALEEDVTELRRSNADLVEFASVAAHELRSPLQTIFGLSELLVDHAGSTLDGEGVEYLQGIQRNTARLHELVEGLLTYAQIGTTVRLREEVDCVRVLEETVDALASRINDTGAEVSTIFLPTVIGDATEVALLFQNLVSNAIKFHRPGVAPKIDVSALQEHGKWHFQLADNGVGIDPEDHERVFRVFQRVPQRATAGSGIGLAICKRIVEGHGGTIWIEPRPGFGTTVSFTFPIPVCWSPF